MEDRQTQTEMQKRANNLEYIPVQFSSNRIHPMNQMEKSLVGTIRKIRGIKGKECRICLEADQQQSNMIIPCKCTGSIEVTHQHCLKQWIKRRIEQNQKQRARCEVCDTQFNYKLSNTRTFDCDELTKNYNKDKKSMICFCTLYGTFLALFVTLIVLIAVANQTEIFLTNFLSSGGGMTIIVSVLTIFLLGLAVIGIIFISEYVVREDVVVSQVLSYQQPRNFIKNFKIHFKQ